ncbi:hypothetical protein AO742_27255, partial [Pseudomonas citronellolis]
MQVALGVVVLPREAQVHHGVVRAAGLAVAEGVGLPLPGQALVVVAGQPRGVEVVAVQVEHAGVARMALVVVGRAQGGQGQAVEPQVVLFAAGLAVPVVGGFAEQLAVGAVEVGGEALRGQLGDALAVGVVAVLGDFLAVDPHVRQAALGVIAEQAAGAVLE